MFTNRSTRTTFLAAVVASGMIVASCSSTSAPESSSTESSSTESSALVDLDSAALDTLVEDTASQFHEIGMVVLIKTPEGDYVNTWGATELGGTEPPTLDTKVRVGSNTKTWTGTAILQMIQEGKLAIDDPVSKYRPDVPNGDNITIGQLLDMRSGLYNYTQTLELNTALDLDTQKVWNPEELVALGLSNPPYSAPGTEYHYSNTNTVLLGLIAEQLDGKPIAQIFQDRFFGPLGLSGTSFPANTDTSIPAPYSNGYSYSGNVETLGEGKESLSPEKLAAIEAGTVQPRITTNDNPSWTWSAGQGISTADDVATWVQALVGGDLLDEKTQQLRMDSVTETDGPGSSGYGYGIAQMGPLYGHIGEQPGYNTFMGYDPVNDVTLVVWGNLAPTADGMSPASVLARELVPYIYAGSPAETADDIEQQDETGGN